MKVLRTAFYDGSPNSGSPYGPVLEVIRKEPHNPVDGPQNAAMVCHLSDGTWEFEHNLTVVGR